MSIYTNWSQKKIQKEATVCVFTFYSAFSLYCVAVCVEVCRSVR